MDTHSELIWANLQFTNAKLVFITSYYVPHTNKPKAIENLADSLSSVISKSRSPNIIIGGDFNLGDIDWKTWSTTNPKAASVPRSFLNFLLKNSLSQLVTEVTRPVSNSVLDLITTTCPQLISDIDYNPSISDHLFVTFNVNLKPKQLAKPQRKIYNFHEADIDKLKQNVNGHTQEFLGSNPISNSVDKNWEIIRNFLLESMDENVPSKMSLGKRHLSWITRDLKRQMRKRDKLHSLARKHQSTYSWSKFHQFRNKVATLVHRAHEDYVNNIIGGSLAERPKTSCQNDAD